MILLMGIAGSGKGTQGELLADKAGYRVISTGDLLRNYGSDSQHARMHKGEILDDTEVTALLDQALNELPDADKVILDGYPRRTSQADWLLEQQQKGKFKLERVLHLLASPEAVKARLQARARVDDHDEAIDERFREYEQATLPILEHLEKAKVPVNQINAERPIETIHTDIMNLLKD